MSATTETLRALLSRLVRRELAKLGIVTFHEYRVVLQAAQYVELQAVRPTVGLPDVARCVARPGAAGYSMTYKLGSTVLVGFVEGDPARPFIAFGPEVEDIAPPDWSEEQPGAATSLPKAVAIGAAGESSSVTIDAAGADSTINVGAEADEIHLGDATGAVVRDGDTVMITISETPLTVIEGALFITSLSRSKVKA